MCNEERQKTKEIQSEVLKTMHDINYRKIKHPKFIDNTKEIESIDEISFGAVRQEIFQDGETVINKQDIATYLYTNKKENKG